MVAGDVNVVDNLELMAENAEDLRIIILQNFSEEVGESECSKE